MELAELVPAERTMSECVEPSASEAADQCSLRGPMILAKVITDALEKKKQGVTSDYGAVIEHLSASQMKVDGMKRWLHALRLCVSHLSREHSQLVSATLRFTWFTQSAELVDLYINYLSCLLSAQTGYLRTVLQGLVCQLWQPHPEVGGDLAFYNIHRAIGTILELIPTAPSLLATLLSKHFPFKGKGPEIQELALRNVLHVMSYCPTLRDDILELVVHQMLLIDVEVPSQSTEEEEGGGGGPEDEEMQFHVEMDTEGENSVVSDKLTAVHSQRPLMSNDMAEKLDIMMSICFEYLHSICHDNGMVVVDSAVSVFKSLLKIFDCVLLPTYACSHVQFLLFKVTSYHKSFPSHFLEFLWERFITPSTPTVLRQTCAAYMASYIARAKFVPLETAKRSLSIMVLWIHQYIDCCSAELLRPEMKHHAVFFSLCQTVFYVFVFRHKSFTEMPGGISFIRQLNLERIVSSRLNPLKVCLGSVVEVFANLTSRYELLFCYTILEQNKRLVITSGSSESVGGASVSAAQASNPLDCFFPFDPYTLKRSSRYLEGLYTDWEQDDIEEADDVDQVAIDTLSPQSSLQSSSYYGSKSNTLTHSLDLSISFSPS